jgi:Leucine-rich repeat (LRR) protein
MRTLTSIEGVSISWNRNLKSLPDWIGDLTSLKKLYASECGLTHLPDRYVNIMISFFSIIILTSVPSSVIK